MIKSRYIPLTQQPWCCVPTCFQMIMQRHNFPLVDQETLAAAMGLVIPENDRYLFQQDYTGPQPASGWGTQIGPSQRDPNKIFLDLNIPLHVTWNLSFNNPHALRKYLEDAEAADKDILLCFDWGTLHNKPQSGGHVCVFDHINNGSVRFIDPEYRAPKWQEVLVEKLYRAIMLHGEGNSCGCWEVEKV